MEIKERQTVDRAKHPELGEGRAVYDNGPAFFLADSGEVEQFTSIDLGGFGMSGSWLRAKRADGTQIQLDTTKRQGGDCHWRAMTYDVVRGWLVAIARDVTEPHVPFWSNRWEPDGSEHVKLYVTLIEVGTPGALKRSARRKNKRLLAHEEHWCTWTLTDGTTFVWCHERNAEKALGAMPQSKQGSLAL